MLGGDPDEKQQAILRDIDAGERRISVRSGHRVGKTTTLAWAITWFACTRFPQKVICTAPTSSQLYDALASETKSWFKKLPKVLLDCFEIKTDAIVFLPAPEESFVSFVTSRAETPEALAGKHSANLLLICDEASGIPEPVYEAASGSMAAHNATMILTGNPVRTSGLFFDTFHKLRGRWKTYHISGENHPRVSADFVAEMIARHGRDSNQFRVRVLGEFPTTDDDTIIPFELVEAALKRDVQAKRVLPIWGVDCARFGADASALAKRKGNVLQEPVKEYRGLDTMQLVGRVKHEWDRTPIDERPSEILVDVIGIGAGVCDRLFEMGLPARGINVSESPSLKGLDLNLRVELWFEGRAWFEARDCFLAGDDALAAELVQQRYKFTSSGKRQAESKEEAKKRGVRSPNRADAFLLTFAGTAVAAGGGAKGKSWATPIHRQIKGIV